MNLGNSVEHTMLELGNVVIAVTGSHSEMVSLTLPQDDPKRRKPDVSFAKEKLNWEVRTSLIHGIEETVKYFRTKI